MSHAAPTPMEPIVPTQVGFCQNLQAWLENNMPDGRRLLRQVVGLWMALLFEMRATGSARRPVPVKELLLAAAAPVGAGGESYPAHCGQVHATSMLKTSIPSYQRTR